MSLVVAGEQQPAEVHALGHAINAALGSVGTTLYYTGPVEAQPVNHLESLRELCADIEAGKVETLVILGANPVYTAPHDFDFASKIGFDKKTKSKKVKNTICVSSHFDETAELCDWHVAESHFLETWGDARAFDGTVSVIQPLIAPLYHTHSAREVLAAFGDKPGISDYDALRERLKAAYPSGEYERFWRMTLNDGLIAGSAFPPSNVSAKFSAGSLPAVKTASAGALVHVKDQKSGKSQKFQIVGSAEADPTRPTSIRTRPPMSSNSFFGRTLAYTTAASQTTAGCRNCRSR